MEHSDNTETTPTNTAPADSINTETTEALLTAIEARILGSLMEKQLTTPDLYPLTLNSLVTACNQKTSREPAMNLQNGEVQHCVNQLEGRDFVDIEYASRADKYKQKITRSLHFDKQEQAVFCLMLFRGPQTLNELLSRSKRMYEFESANEIEELLEKHLGKLKPLVFKVPAQAGQREDRYTHTLCGEPDLSNLPAPSRTRTSETTSQATDELKARVTKLEAQVAWLMNELGAENPE
jgi:uncharacterized protein YceH (UPF0502 family)